MVYFLDWKLSEKGLKTAIFKQMFSFLNEQEDYILKEKNKFI